MAKKVLVLCQRKTGFVDEYTSERVEEVITPKLETLAKNILETEDYTIEYLSDVEGYEGDVDILGKLKNKKTDDFTTDFLSKNKKSYSLIILNTCPFSWMPYPVIYKLLTDDGLMVFSSYPWPENILDENILELSSESYAIAPDSGSTTTPEEPSYLEQSIAEGFGGRELYIPPVDRFSNITTEDMDMILYKKIPVTQRAGKLYKNKVSMKSKSKSNRCRSKNKYKNKYKNKNLTKRNCPRKINKTFKTK